MRQHPPNNCHHWTIRPGPIIYIVDSGGESHHVSLLGGPCTHLDRYTNKIRSQQVRKNKSPASFFWCVVNFCRAQCSSHSVMQSPCNYHFCEYVCSFVCELYVLVKPVGQILTCPLRFSSIWSTSSLLCLKQSSSSTNMEGISSLSRTVLSVRRASAVKLTLIPGRKCVEQCQI